MLYTVNTYRMRPLLFGKQSLSSNLDFNFEKVILRLRSVLTFFANYACIMHQAKPYIFTGK